MLQQDVAIATLHKLDLVNLYFPFHLVAVRPDLVKPSALYSYSCGKVKPLIFSNNTLKSLGQVSLDWISINSRLENNNRKINSLSPVFAKDYDENGACFLEYSFIP